MGKLMRDQSSREMIAGDDAYKWRNENTSFYMNGWYVCTYVFHNEIIVTILHYLKFCHWSELSAFSTSTSVENSIFLSCSRRITLWHLFGPWRTLCLCKQGRGDRWSESVEKQDRQSLVPWKQQQAQPNQQFIIEFQTGKSCWAKSVLYGIHKTDVNEGDFTHFLLLGML